MVTLEEIKNLVEKTKSLKLEYPVCVPSYKFREEAWLIHNLDKIEAPVYLFVYEDDYTASGYDKFPWSDNVNIVKIKEQDFKDLNIRWRGIQPKRRYMQIYMNNLGIHNYFMIDDDYSHSLIYPSKQRDNKCKSYITEDIDLCNGLKFIQEFSKNYEDYKVIGINMGCICTHFTKLKGIRDNLIIRLYLFKNFNNELLFTDKNLHEDHYMYIESVEKKIKVGVIDFLSEKQYNNKIKSTCETIDLNFNDYLEYPWYVSFRKTTSNTKDNQNVIYTACNLRKIKNQDKSYDTYLYELVKKYDFEAVKNYVNNEENKKLDVVEDW